MGTATNATIFGGTTRLIYDARFGSGVAMGFGGDSANGAGSKPDLNWMVIGTYLQ